MRDIELSSTKAQSFFEQLMQSMDMAVQTTLSKVASVTRGVESDVANMSNISFLRRGGVEPVANVP